MYFDVMTIPDFPNYDITVEGKVFNAKTGREMTLSPTQSGELTVGLMKGGIEYRRSVKVLVARAFVDGETESFNTPILLDMNKENLHADNIRWRPRWFAHKYARQFHDEPFPSWYYNGPIYDHENGTQYATIVNAAMTHGFICLDIRLGLLNETRVFPTGELYSYNSFI